MQKKFFRDSKIRNRFKCYLLEFEMSKEFEGLSQKFDELLLLGDRVLLACEGEPEHGVAYERITKAFEEFPQDVEKSIPLSLLSSTIEPWFKAILWLLNKDAGSNKKRDGKATLVDYLVALNLLNKREAIAVKDNELHEIEDHIRRFFRQAKGLKNDESHGNQILQSVKDLGGAITIVTILGSLFKHANDLRKSLRGLIVRDFHDEPNIDSILSKKFNIRAYHLNCFKLREKLLGNIERKLTAHGNSSSQFLLVEGPEGSGKTGLSVKCSERINSSIKALGVHRNNVIKKAPWLPGSIIYLGGCKGDILTITKTILEQANVMLMDPVAIPSFKSLEDLNFRSFGSSSKSILSFHQKHESLGEKSLEQTTLAQVCKNAIEQALSKLCEETGDAILIIDAIDELFNTPNFLRIIPDTLRGNSSVLVTGRDQAVVDFKSERIKLDLDIISLSNFTRSELPCFFGLSDNNREESSFMDLVYENTEGLAWAINSTLQEMSKNTSSRFDASNICTLEAISKKNYKRWRFHEDKEKQQALELLLPLYVLFENCIGLTRDELQDYLEFNQIDKDWHWIRETLSWVESDLEISVTDNRLIFRNLANYCLREVYSKKDLLKYFQNITAWLAYSEEVRPKLILSFGNCWFDPLDGAITKKDASKLWNKWLKKLSITSLNSIIDYFLEELRSQDISTFFSSILVRGTELFHPPSMGLLGFQKVIGGSCGHNIQEGANLLRSAIEFGYDRAKINLGWLLAIKEVPQVRKNEAEDLLRDAIRSNDKDTASIAKVYLGAALIEGTVLTQNTKEGESLLRHEIHNGSKSAKVFLGCYLMDGDLLKSNWDEGESFLRDAIAAGDSEASRLLGYHLIKGRKSDDDLIEGVKLYRKAIEGGDLRAMEQLATMLFDGDQITQNTTEAETLMWKAVEAGDSFAMCLLGERLMKGDGVEQNLKKGESLLKKSIARGEVPAMNYLGERLLKGDGIQKNIQEGMRLLEKSVMREDAWAMGFLGESYYVGNLIRKNKHKGEELLLNVLKQGWSSPLILLSKRILKGDGIKKNPKESEALLKKAIEMGNADAMTELAVRYLKQNPTLEDQSRSKALLQKATKKGSVNAMGLYSQLLLNAQSSPKEIKKGERLLRNAISLNHIQSMHLLSNHLFSGKILKKNETEAEALLHLAIKKKDSEAMRVLGSRMLDADGVPYNQKEGVSFLLKSIQLGNCDAMLNLGIRYIRGDGVKKNSNKGLSFLKKAIEAGNDNAMHNLGDMMLQGLVSSGNTTEGINLLRAAVQKNNIPAMLNLGSRLINGDKVKKDLSDGTLILRKAAENNDPEAMQLLGELLIKSKNTRKEGESFLNKASSFGIKSSPCEPVINASKSGRLKFINLKLITLQNKQQVSVANEGTIAVLDKNQKQVDLYNIPKGALLYFLDGELVKKGKLVAQWDPYSIPILSEFTGVVDFNDIIPGKTIKYEHDGRNRLMVIVINRGNFKPKITITNPETGNSSSFLLTPGTIITVENGSTVVAGSIIAKIPRVQ